MLIFFIFEWLTSTIRNLHAGLILLRDDTYMTSMKFVKFSRPPPPPPPPACPTKSKILPPLELGRPISNNPPPFSKWYKRKHDPTMTIISVIPSSQSLFLVQYQLINLVWRSVDFFSFSRSQYCLQSNFKKLKTSFSSSSYSEKTRWGQGC